MGTFTRIKVNNLHGNANKKEHSPDGSEDKNVFDIKQGVSIFIALRNKSESEVKHAELWGECETKYAWLEEHSLGNTKFSAISPNSPYYFFIPKNNANLDEYQTYLKLTEIFGVSGVGIVTARDSLTIHHTADEVWNTVTRFSKLRTEQARQEFNLRPDVQSWKVHLAQEDCRESGQKKSISTQFSIVHSICAKLIILQNPVDFFVGLCSPSCSICSIEQMSRFWRKDSPNVNHSPTFGVRRGLLNRLFSRAHTPTTAFSRCILLAMVIDRVYLP